MHMKKQKKKQDGNNYSVISDEIFNYIKEGRIENGKQTFLYKDGKVKETYDYGNDNRYTNYGKVEGDNFIYIQLDKDMKYTGGAAIAYAYGINPLEAYREQEILGYTNSEIRNEEYETQEYYVIRKNYKNGNHTDIWINKESMELFKIECINMLYGGAYSCEERKYTITKGNITDEDIEYEMTQEEYEQFENIKKFM